MNRFIYMDYSPKLKGKASQYSRNYRGHRVVETTDGVRPVSSRAKNVIRVVYDSGGVNTGTTERSEGFKARQHCLTLVAQLNGEAQ